ncbi:kinase-like domain-containing protein [Gorgonomyces haynaldii]|nr:kinase-like domain-containing protein [Gorgonomyces haynaldii]
MQKDSWLLRLFESSFFDVQLALNYLQKYKTPGIHHYIVQKLQKFPEQELEFVLPQLCHLLLTNPDSSAVLERFIVDLCRQSSHMAILTLWYLESYMAEQSNSMMLCKRIYDTCHNIVFHDARLSEPRQSLGRFNFTKNAHIHTALVGMGSVLGSFATPHLTRNTKPLIMTQGLQERYLGYPVIDSVQHNESTKPPLLDSFGSRLSITRPAQSPSLDELANGNAFSFKTFMQKTSQRVSRSPTQERSPSLTEKMRRHSFEPPVLVKDAKLLTSHYFFSEMQFIMTLVDISDRLRQVPKPIRQSSLIAELTLLNHNLPADVCIPFLCSAQKDEPHHRVVRVSLSDCVVLNSADRVPYLVLVEVFEPTRSMQHTREQQQEEAVKRVSKKVSFEAHSDQSDASSNSAQYHQSVIHRRQSLTVATKNLSDSVSIPSPIEFSRDDFSEKMKTAAVMLAQLYQQELMSPTQQKQIPVQFEDIRSRVIKEMMLIEQQRMDALSKTQGATFDLGGVDDMISKGQELHLMQDMEDPSASVFKEPWSIKRERIRKQSPFGDNDSWRLLSFIVKSGADLRQEQLALQLIKTSDEIWREAQVPVRIYPFSIMITSEQSGLIETIPDSISIHSIKKDGYARRLNAEGIAYTLYDHFIKEFGEPGTETFLIAQNNFMRSLAGYSILCYLLQIKDRHNGNILLDHQGHVTHIDFGFMLSNSPGSVGFELAPFKLPQEYVDVLGGIYSPVFQSFKKLMLEAFLALRKRADRLLGIVEVMEKGILVDTRFQTALTQPNQVTNALRERFQLSLTDAQVEEHLDRLIDSSTNNIFTKLYDSFQVLVLIIVLCQWHSLVHNQCRDETRFLIESINTSWNQR